MTRCVHCSRPREAHVEDGLCYPTSTTRYETMALPAGKTCSDCAYHGFCTGFLGDVAGNTSCDWFPIRFVPKLVKPARETPL